MQKCLVNLTSIFSRNVINCILYLPIRRYSMNNLFQPIPNMLLVAFVFPTWKMIVKTFCSIFYLLYKSFHEVLQSSIIYVMLQPEPFTSIIVPSSTIFEYGFSASISIPELSEELITHKNRPSLERCIIKHVFRLGS